MSADLWLRWRRPGDPPADPGQGEYTRQVTLVFDDEDGAPALAEAILHAWQKNDHEIALTVDVDEPNLQDMLEDLAHERDDDDDPPPSGEVEGEGDIGPIDTTNRHLVSAHGDAVLVGAPPSRAMSRAEALALASWLTVMAEATDDEVLEARRAVENT